jgi:hypothetical protein
MDDHACRWTMLSMVDDQEAMVDGRWSMVDAVGSRLRGDVPLKNLEVPARAMPLAGRSTGVSV